MINLNVQLADGTSINIDELIEQLNNTHALTLLLNREIVMHPENLQWVEGSQSFEEAERVNEEDNDGNGGGYLPYNWEGILIRDLDPDEQDNEDEYYFQVETAEWSGSTEFEKYVADWMNDNPDSYKDLITNGCISGMVPDLIYENQIIEHIQEYKRDLEIIIQEIANNLDMGFLFGQCEYKPSNFTFNKLVWMCFEETVRKTLQHFQLSDI